MTSLKQYQVTEAGAEVKGEAAEGGWDGGGWGSGAEVKEEASGGGWGSGAEVKEEVNEESSGGEAECIGILCTYPYCRFMCFVHC